MEVKNEEQSETKKENELFSIRKLINQAQKIKENEEKNSINNLKKMNVNSNISEIKENKKEQKDKKAYLNFIQTIKKANYNRKDKTKNLMEVDPKVKVARAIDKIHKLNRIFHNTYRKTNREEEKEKQEMNQRNEEENYNTNKTDNIYDKKGFTGFVLMKQNQGENIFQINLEGTLEEINKIFRMYNIEIDGGPVELIHTKASARPINEETLNYVGNKEPSPFIAALRKKAMETDNVKREDNNSKLMQEKIQKFKNQQRKTEDEDAHINSTKKTDYIKNNNKDEEDVNKNNLDKNRAKTIEEKEKDRERSYSKAMDRFKKRFKKDHSVEVRSKKSDRIIEISKQLENVMGNSNISTEINNVKKKEQENNFEQILDNKPVISKKSKIIKKFE